MQKPPFSQVGCDELPIPGHGIGRPLFQTSLLLGAAAVVLAAARAGAQDAPPAIKQQIDTTVTTEDMWQLPISYYSSGRGETTPVVILLHREGGNHLVWNNGFAERLQQEGYAVVAVDLRKHGESKLSSDGKLVSRRKRGNTSRLLPVDYRNMVTKDLEAVKQFIFDEHQRKQLNINKTAIIAPEMSAVIASAFAVADWNKRPYNDFPTPEASTPRGQDVRALVFLSPDANLRGINGGPLMMEIRRPDWNVAVLTCYGALDEQAAKDAEDIHRKLVNVTGNENRIYLHGFPYKLRGTDLLGKPDIKIEDLIVTFLQRHLMELPGEWRNRENRLLRQKPK